MANNYLKPEIDKQIMATIDCLHVAASKVSPTNFCANRFSKLVGALRACNNLMLSDLLQDRSASLFASAVADLQACEHCPDTHAAGRNMRDAFVVFLTRCAVDPLDKVAFENAVVLAYADKVLTNELKSRICLARWQIYGYTHQRSTRKPRAKRHRDCGALCDEIRLQTDSFLTALD